MLLFKVSDTIFDQNIINPFEFRRKKKYFYWCVNDLLINSDVEKDIIVVDAMVKIDTNKWNLWIENIIITALNYQVNIRQFFRIQNIFFVIVLSSVNHMQNILY